MNTPLSDHFTLEEATFSSTAARLGIDNTTPPAEVVEQMKRTATKLEKVRALLLQPLHIDSFYRCLALNTALGSKATSQHISGNAVDFTCSAYGDPVTIAKRLVEVANIIRYDQLIMEHTWIHISFASPDDTPRGHVLSLLANGGYATGITDKEGNLL